MPIKARLKSQKQAQVRGSVLKANKQNMYLALRDDPTELYDINGHLIEITNTEFDEAIATQVIVFVDGGWRPRNEYDESDVIIEQEITITIPDEGLYSYVTLASVQAPACLCLFEAPICLEACDQHFRSHKLNLNPVTRNRMTGFEGEDRFIERTATGRITDSVEFWIPNSEIFTAANTDIIYDSVTVAGQCTDCDLCERINNGYRVGTDGTNLLAEITNDSFVNNFTSFTNGTNVVDTNIGYTVFADESIVLVGTNDSGDPATSTTGQILYSVDDTNLVAARLDSGALVAAPIHDIVAFDGGFLAIGAGEYYTSTDGLVWCQIATPAGTEVLYEAAYDESTSIAYIAGAVDNTLAVGAAFAIRNGNLIDITALVGNTTSPTLTGYALQAVWAYDDWVIFGGDQLSVFENFAASKAGVFENTLTNSTATDFVIDLFDSTVKGFALLTDSNGNIWRRSPLSAQNWETQTINSTLTGAPLNISDSYLENLSFGNIDIHYSDGSRLRLTDCRVKMCADNVTC